MKSCSAIVVGRFAKDADDAPQILTDYFPPHRIPGRYQWYRRCRARLHIVVTSTNGQVAFESGKLNPDGSIVGNANDADPACYSPYYPLITKLGQVEIFEAILGDSTGHVTTGLLYAAQHLKDNRILPAGFDKSNVPADIAVHGNAADDPAFTAGSNTTRYKIATNGAKGPFHITAQLEYEPIGYRWAHNFSPYHASELQHFVRYVKQDAAHSALAIAHAEASTDMQR